MSERRYLAPLPLGGDEGPPWSKGLMARALAATGLTPTRAYELARRADADMIQRGSLELDLDRLAEVAAEVLGEQEAARTMRRLRRLQALQHLERTYGAEVVHVSGSLSDRAALRSELAGLDCDVVVVEVKAAAIDVVAEEAARKNVPVVLAANDILPLAGEPDLDLELERLAREAIATAVVGV